MRYYLGQCEYKWSHVNKSMEPMWIMREIGSEVYKTVEENNWHWTWLRTNSQILPGDTYCRCDIYVDIPDTKQGTLFALKYPEAKAVGEPI